MKNIWIEELEDNYFLFHKKRTLLKLSEDNYYNGVLLYYNDSPNILTIGGEYSFNKKDSRKLKKHEVIKYKLLGYLKNE